MTFQHFLELIFIPANYQRSKNYTYLAGYLAKNTPGAFIPHSLNRGKSQLILVIIFY